MISYIGGKSKIGKWIKDFIPKDMSVYVEPFSGMFWVFFNMDLSEYPNLKTVVYNDYNRLNSNLFDCVRQPDILLKELEKYPYQQLGEVNTPSEYSELFYKFQKEVFDDNVEINNCDYEIAAKYVYVLTQIFSGAKPEKAKYMDYKGKYKCKYKIFMEKLNNKMYIDHFNKITFVENLDFEDVIKKYDSISTYFYLDPPYFKTENYYSNHDFSLKDHERLANVLQNIEGKFSLSYYYFDLLDVWFPKNDYNWVSQYFNKAAAASKGKIQNKGKELLIMNYE